MKWRVALLDLISINLQLNQIIEVSICHKIPSPLSKPTLNLI